MPACRRRTSRSTRSRASSPRSTSRGRTSRRTWTRRSRHGRASSELQWHQSWTPKERSSRSRASDEDIQKRLSDLETQKNNAFNAQLASFKTQARRGSEKVRSRPAGPQDAVQRRSREGECRPGAGRSASRQREADLQAQLAQKTNELQSAQAQTQAQLAALTSQKQQEDLVSQQLIGLYSVAQTDIAAKNYPKALTSLQAIGAYVNSSEVATLPGIARRRPVDEFIVESLTNLVQGEMDKGKVDTASLVDAANRMSTIRSPWSPARRPPAPGGSLTLRQPTGRRWRRFPRSRRATRISPARCGTPRLRGRMRFARGSRAPKVRTPRAVTPKCWPLTATRWGTCRRTPVGGRNAFQHRHGRFGTGRAEGPGRPDAGSGPGAGPGDDAAPAAQVRRCGSPVPRGAAELSAELAGWTLFGGSTKHSGLNAQASSDIKGQTDQAAALNAQLASVQKDLSSRAGEITGIKKSLMGLVGMSGDPAATPTADVMTAVNRKFGDLSGGAGFIERCRGARLRQAQANAETLQKRIDDLSAEKRPPARLTPDGVSAFPIGHNGVRRRCKAPREP